MKQFYRVQSVAKAMGVSSQTIRNRIDNGEVKAQRFGRLFLIPIEEVARMLGKSVQETVSILEDKEDSLTRQSVGA